MAESKVAARGKGPKLPVVMSANDLMGGEVVFWGADDWTPDPRAAQVAGDEAAAEALEARGRAAVAANRVVDAYLVEVTLEHGTPTPRHFREAIRFRGPTIHPEFGKQAEY